MPAPQRLGECQTKRQAKTGYYQIPIAANLMLCKTQKICTDRWPLKSLGNLCADVMCRMEGKHETEHQENKKTANFSHFKTTPLDLTNHFNLMTLVLAIVWGCMTMPEIDVFCFLVSVSSLPLLTN